MATPTQKILIYRLGSLGDTVMALPVFHKIREVYPNADITLLTNSPVANKAAPLESVLGQGYFFNRVLAYPVGTRSPRILLDLVKQIKVLEIDTVIYLAGVRTLKTLLRTKVTVLRDKWFFRAAGIKKTIGFPSTRADFELSVDALTGDLEWEAKRLSRRAEALGVINLNDDACWDLKFTADELGAARQHLAAFSNNELIIAASTGTKSQVNDWEENNWLHLFTQLKHTLPGAGLIMLGGPDDFEFSSRCIEAWGGRGINLCGKTSPRVSGAVLKHASLFIGHDSGPMHLSAAGGTPCVAVFSARHFPRQWYPRGNFNKIIYHKTDCAGCGLDVCVVQQKKCILSISVNEVVTAVMDILGSAPINDNTPK